MNKLLPFFLGLILITISCGEDRTTEFTLRHDGENESAPLLDPDIYEAAARFPASVTSDFTGLNLTEVSYYVAATPLQTSLKIYEGGTTNVPGQVIYEAQLTGNITQNTFNTHVLSQPIEMTGADLWISIRFRLNRQLQTIGCDPGPAVTDGDWLYQESDGQWIPLSQRTAININWNIRGILVE